MTEISETEIKSMTKEQNYMRGYEDGKSDVLDKIKAEIKQLPYQRIFGKVSNYSLLDVVVEIIDKYKAESEDT